MKRKTGVRENDGRGTGGRERGGRLNAAGSRAPSAPVN